MKGRRKEGNGVRVFGEKEKAKVKVDFSSANPVTESSLKFICSYFGRKYNNDIFCPYTMSLFKAAVVKIQRGQALVKASKAPITAKIVLDGKNVTEFYPGRDIIGHVEVTYNHDFQYCGTS